MKIKLKRWKAFRVPSSFLSVRVAVILLALEIILAVASYMALEGFHFGEAIYMTIITISTVGFTEVKALSATGRLITSILIIINVGVFAYLLAVFSYFVVQGEIFKKMHTNLINTGIKKLYGHIILCGYGKYGAEIASHFISHKKSFVVIESEPQRIEEIQKNEAEMFYVQGDATQDEILIKAGIKRAGAIICALRDDSDNVFIVLTARQLNPGISIISRAINSNSRRKLLMAGADHVVMPEQIGGFFMATLVSKPDTVDFFSFIINNEKISDVGFEEVSYETLPQQYRNKSVRELRIREETGANIIALQTAGGEYIVNPSPETVLSPHSSFFVLGDKAQLKKLREYLSMGRDK